MRVEWDPQKARANRAKHGLSFEEAGGLFKSGADYLEIYDEVHSKREDDVVRILSARMATSKERRRFELFQGERHER